MNKTQEQALEFINVAKQLGWSIEVRTDSIVTITKQIGRDNREAFCVADMEYGSILGLAPLKGGSVWGTDGGGIGALSAMSSGVFRMNKSGSGKRFLAAVKKLLN